MLITKRDIFLILGIVSFAVAATLVEATFLNRTFFVAFSVFVSAIIFMLIETYRRISKLIKDLGQSLEKQNENYYKQIEALLSIFFCTNPESPFPSTGGWSASPDFLKKLTEVIYKENPSTVLEASSGTSTLVIAYCLKKLGSGKVVALEHDEDYAKITRDLLKSHGLSEIATVIYAPLKKFDIQQKQWLWYDISSLKDIGPVDLFVIDGPPKDTQSLARYPALPLLFENIQKGGTIMMDDGARIDETQIVEAWKKEFPNIQAEFIKLEKGAFLIKK